VCYDCSCNSFVAKWTELRHMPRHDTRSATNGAPTNSVTFCRGYCVMFKCSVGLKLIQLHETLPLFCKSLLWKGLYFQEKLSENFFHIFSITPLRESTQTLLVNCYATISVFDILTFRYYFNIIASTNRDGLRHWRVGFSHFSAIVKTTVSSGKLSVLISERDRLCAVRNGAALLLI